MPLCREERERGASEERGPYPNAGVRGGVGEDDELEDEDGEGGGMNLSYGECEPTLTNDEDVEEKPLLELASFDFDFEEGVDDGPAMG